MSDEERDITWPVREGTSDNGVPIMRYPRHWGPMERISFQSGLEAGYKIAVAEREGTQ